MGRRGRKIKVKRGRSMLRDLLRSPPCPVCGASLTFRRKGSKVYWHCGRCGYWGWANLKSLPRGWKIPDIYSAIIDVVDQTIPDIFVLDRRLKRKELMMK